MVVGRATASARWAFLGLGSKVLIQGVSAFAVARIVGPETYGVIGLGVVYVTLTMLIIDQGMGQTLIRAETLHRADVATVQVTTVLIALALSLVTVVSAGPVASFFDADSLEWLLIVLGLGLILKAVMISGQAVMQRDFGFRYLAGCNVVSTVFGVAAGLAAAVMGAGAMTLAIQILITDAIYAAGVIHRTGVPVRSANIASLRRILGFSAQIAGSQWLGFVSRNVDNILIGRVLGQAALGQYSVSYRFMMLPITNLVMVANRVLLPTYSQIRGDVAAFRRAFLRSTSLMALTAAPLMAVLIVFAQPLILGALGPEWQGAVVPTQILAGVAIVQAQTSLITPAIVAFGRGAWQLWWSLGSTVLAVATFGGTVHWGLNAVCLGYAVLNLVTLPVPIILVGRLGHFSLADFARSVREGLVAGVVVLVVGIGVRVGLSRVGAAHLVTAFGGGVATMLVSAGLLRLLIPRGVADLVALMGRTGTGSVAAAGS